MVVGVMWCRWEVSCGQQSHHTHTHTLSIVCSHFFSVQRGDLLGYLVVERVHIHTCCIVMVHL